MRDKKPFWHGRCQKGFYNQVLKFIITAVVYRPFRKNETANLLEWYRRFVEKWNRKACAHR